MLQVLTAARKTSFGFSMRMHIDTVRATTRPGSTLRRSRGRHGREKTFEYGTWGGEIRAEFEPKPGDIVAAEHWCSSGFANTDLDLQLKKHGIQQLIVIGLIAHTCVEATVRYAAELGYEVTVVKDATANYSDETCTPLSKSISQTTLVPS